MCLRSELLRTENAVSMADFFQTRNPFNDYKELQNNATGVAIPATVNTDLTEKVCRAILQDMEGKR